MSSSVATRLIAVSTGILGAGLTALHYHFGIRLRSSLKFGVAKLKTQENTDQQTNEHPSSSLPSKLSILSQNIWCSFVAGGPNRRQRLKLLVDNLHKDNPDVLCLQEMFIFALGPLLLCGDFEYLHRELVHKLGYSYYSDPMQTLPSVIGGNSGLMIYSKYPLQQCNSCAFDTRIRRFFSAKGWMSATLALSAGADNEPASLRIINTHFEHENREYIMGQMQVLRDEIMQSEQHRYRVCLGDFNICSKFTFEEDCESPHRLYDILQPTMAQCGLEHDVFCEEERTFRVTEKEPNACYDHMFVNEPMKKIISDTMIVDYSQKDGDLVMSDHYGLCIQLKIDQNK